MLLHTCVTFTLPDSLCDQQHLYFDIQCNIQCPRGTEARAERSVSHYRQSVVIISTPCTMSVYLNTARSQFNVLTFQLSVERGMWLPKMSSLLPHFSRLTSNGAPSCFCDRWLFVIGRPPGPSDPWEPITCPGGIFLNTSRLWR